MTGRPLLAIDTSGTRALVALGSTTGALIDERRWPAGYRHGEELLTRTDELLRSNGVALSDLGGIVVGTGPGAFTGMRVGIATAKALARGLDIPIAGIATSGALLAVADAGVGEQAVLLLPAGPSDRVFVVAGRATLVKGGEEPELPADAVLVAVDLPGRAPEAAMASRRPSGGRPGVRAARARSRPHCRRRRRRRAPRARVRDAAARHRRGEGRGALVARPSVAIVVDRMSVDDLPAVQEIERESFTTPWPPHAYRSELENNRMAHYIVARHGDRVVGFAGMWLMVDEAHITTFAVRRAWRRQGVGERLLIAMLALAEARGAREATLEVRPSNHPARRLYEKYGFALVGLRPRYYSDDNEDALIMTTGDLGGRQMRDRLAGLRAEVAKRPGIELGEDGLPIERREAAAGEAAAGAGAEGAGAEGRRPPAMRPKAATPSRPTCSDRAT